MALTMIFFFFRCGAKGTGNRKKMDRWDYNIMKNLSSKDSVSRVRRQPTEWEKVFAKSHV